MGWLLWVGFCVALAVISALWPSKRTFRPKPNPPRPHTPPPKDALIQRSRFKHRGYYHNRYWTKGKGNGLRPWV